MLRGEDGDELVSGVVTMNDGSGRMRMWAYSDVDAGLSFGLMRPGEEDGMHEGADREDARDEAAHARDLDPIRRVESVFESVCGEVGKWTYRKLGHLVRAGHC